MHLILGILPQNLAIYTLSFELRYSVWVMHEFRAMSDHRRDVLESLTSYSSVVYSLLGCLKQLEACRKSSRASHSISREVYKLMNRDISVLVVQLVLFLNDSTSYKRFLACRGPIAQDLVDLLQDLLDHEDFFVVKPFLFKALLRLSRASGLHPRCFPIWRLQKVGKQVAAGGFSDIWKGLVRGQSVSVKIMRLFENEEIESALKEFGREALIWRQLHHPNLLPFFGLYYLDQQLCLVSPWMEYGNILQCLNKAPNGIDRLSLILDVALGLQYLHDNRVVHGDLKAINILVTPSRRACIADFGFSSIANAMTLRVTHSTADTRGGTARYQAPELLQGESQNHPPSDVYAFACVCYEILTGKAPFYELSNDATIIFKVIGGDRPTRPLSCSATTVYDSLWDLIQDCWQGNPDLRPTAAQIVERLIGPSIQATTTQSTTDWDDTFSSKFRRSMQVQPLLPSIAQIKRMLFGDGVVEGKIPIIPSEASTMHRIPE
ncbi:kinase-like domain-containing protein [Mycena rosella]|uniref:Kinase-like domain-containing protein n=1 Tax=Mycena rosella TaxID=1033263 RepID=A0AAD7GUJ1_MYCRO|nr:kinase-like domain-containing protein [Mycena rosella]